MTRATSESADGPPSYRIEFAPRAARQFRSLTLAVQARLAPRIDALATDPRPGAAVRMAGTEDEIYRIRVGDYRVIYEIRDATLLVLVVKIGHRREIYR